MTAHRALNTTLLAAQVMAVVILMAYVGPELLDGPTDHSTDMTVAADLSDAIKSEAAQARFERAAAQVCGNAAWTQDADGAVHCQVRKLRVRGGATTVVAQVQP